MIKIDKFLAFMQDKNFTIEVNSGEYCLTDNMNLSLEQIVEKYVKGEPIPRSLIKTPEYGVQPKNMELSDYTAMTEKLEAIAAKKTAAIKAQQAEAQRKEQQAEAAKTSSTAQPDVTNS